MSLSSIASDSASTQNPWSSTSGTLAPTVQSLRPVITCPTVTAFSVSPAQSGSVFSLASIGAVITLPAVALARGSWWKFQMNAANGTTAWTITAPSAILWGNVIMAATTASGVVLGNTTTTPLTSIAFATGADEGDWVEISCDGTRYFFTGQGRATTSFAIA